MANPAEPAWDPTDFQATLNTFLDRKQWSQNRLSSELGLSQTAVNRWFQPITKTGPNRVTRPRPEVLPALAKLMGYPLGSLQRLCGYPVESTTRRAQDPALQSLTTMIEAGYETTRDDPVRRQLGIDMITAVVQSAWSGQHRPRRSARPRNKEHGDDKPLPLLRCSYA